MLKKELIQYFTKRIANNLSSEKTAREMLSLPLVEIEAFEKDDVTPWAIFNKEYPGKAWCFNSNEFVFIKALYALPKVGFFIVEITENNIPHNVYVLSITYYPTVETNLTRVELEVVVNGTNLSIKNVKLFGDKKAAELLATEEKAVGIGSSIVKRFMVTMRIFTDFQESLDLYPVSVQTQKSRLNKGNMSKVDKRLEDVQYRAPRLIYLNKLPNSKSDTVSTPSGIKQKTHQRPGHWRTLSHPKYKNHEKYLVPKGVRVKPYWVGDTQTEYEGNVYRLITSDSINLPL
jgi:hypothetical protein